MNRYFLTFFSSILLFLRFLTWRHPFLICLSLGWEIPQKTKFYSITVSLNSSNLGIYFFPYLGQECSLESEFLPNLWIKVTRKGLIFFASPAVGFQLSLTEHLRLAQKFFAIFYRAVEKLFFFYPKLSGGTRRFFPCLIAPMDLVYEGRKGPNYVFTGGEQ